MNDFPIIRISIDGMRQEIVHAMMDRQVQMDAHVNDAIKRYAETQLQADIDRIVASTISEAVKREADSYFNYGAGRSFIAAAVAARLGVKEPHP